MNCQEVQATIDGYVDGELDPVRNLETERHMQTCASCTEAYTAHQALRASIRAASLYMTAPANLRTRLRSSVHDLGRTTPALRAMPWRWIGIAASLAIAIAVTWDLALLLHGPSVEDLLTRDIISGHVRSLQAGHLVDVPSADRHRVKPWFTGKLDFSPPVADLTDHDFALVGGRLDYLDNRAVAAVVYRRRQHLINLFIWPSPEPPSAETAHAMNQGYQVFHWTQSGMTYWAVSDLNERELQEFVQFLRQQTH